MIIVNHSIEEVQTFVEAKRLLQTLRGAALPRNMTKKTLIPNLLKQLIGNCETEDVDLLAYKSRPTACGCMGPQRHEILCHCVFSFLLEEYKEEVALLYLEQQKGSFDVY